MSVTHLGLQLKHSKVYENDLEETVRKQVFLRNKMEIAKHNRQYELGQVSFELGLNKYSDMDHNEFISLMGSGLNMT